MTNQHNSEKLLFALEQKLSLLMKISDLTKQIEVGSKRKEGQLNDLLVKRQTLLDRTGKCNHLIDSCIAAMEAETRVKLKRILDGKASPAECSPEEAVLLQYSRKCLALLRSIIAENDVAINNVRAERSRIQKRLGTLRKEGMASTGNMFHSS